MRLSPVLVEEGGAPGRRQLVQRSVLAFAMFLGSSWTEYPGPIASVLAVSIV